MNYLKKVYSTNRFDFFLIVGILIFYIFLHSIKLSVTPLHLYAMYSLKANNEVKEGIAHKLFINGNEVQLKDFNTRKQQYLLKTYKVYDAYRARDGYTGNKEYKEIHRRLPFLQNKEIDEKLYHLPDYKDRMRFWVQDYFNCPNCEISLYKYDIGYNDDYSVFVKDSTKIL